jgi:hypothetical protein
MKDELIIAALNGLTLLAIRWAVFTYYKLAGE